MLAPPSFKVQHLCRCAEGLCLAEACVTFAYMLSFLVHVYTTYIRDLHHKVVLYVKDPTHAQMCQRSLVGPAGWAEPFGASAHVDQARHSHLKSSCGRGRGMEPGACNLYFEVKVHFKLDL